jgi:hypothetical protein
MDLLLQIITEEGRRSHLFLLSRARLGPVSQT